VMSLTTPVEVKKDRTEPMRTADRIDASHFSC
jgi:hypothetical protein